MINRPVVLFGPTVLLLWLAAYWGAVFAPTVEFSPNNFSIGCEWHHKEAETGNGGSKHETEPHRTNPSIFA